MYQIISTGYKIKRNISWDYSSAYLHERNLSLYSVVVLHPHLSSFFVFFLSISKTFPAPSSPMPKTVIHQHHLQRCRSPPTSIAPPAVFAEFSLKFEPETSREPPWLVVDRAPPWLAVFELNWLEEMIPPGSGEFALTIFVGWKVSEKCKKSEFFYKFWG